MSVSEYRISQHRPGCESEPMLPFVTAEVCPTEVTESSTEYEDAECRCKPEKVVVSEGIQVAVPEPIEKVVLQAAVNSGKKTLDLGFEQFSDECR